MLIYAAHTRSRALVKRLKSSGRFGILVTPAYPKPPRNGLPFAIDNGAYDAYMRGEKFDAGALYRTLRGCRTSQARWLVCPDKVADEDSLQFSLWWERRLRGEWPLLLAVQDGMTPNRVEQNLGRFFGLFIGGTMDWKVQTGDQWAALAREHNMHLHVGRVNTINRYHWAEAIGANSIDGSGFTRWTWMLDELEKPPPNLFAGATA